MITSELQNEKPINTTKLGLAWWNTALSPTKKPGRANPQEIQTAAAMLVYLLRLDIHFIALGEIATSDINEIKKITEAELENYTVIDMNNSAGRSHFDSCVAYKTDLIKITEQTDILLRKGTHTTRIGQHIIFQVAGESKPFNTIISHWPSRISLPENSPKRIELGLRLRDKVNTILEADQDAHVILLGDYNDEPFDASISESLRATRDRNLATKKQDLLYNPFWRHLSSYRHADNNMQMSDQGTYFHSSGELTKWRTFDHMMFSSSLLSRDSEWHLDEHETRAINSPEYHSIVIARKHVFDHLPIIGRLTRNI